MKEIRAIVGAYKYIDLSKTKAALATVVGIEGSSYRRTGARMLVLDDGQYLGGISGGCLEGDALRRAQKAIAADTSSVIPYDTLQEDSHQIGIGLGCQGIIHVLFTPLHPEDSSNPVELLSTLTKTRIPRVMITISAIEGNDQLLGKAWIYEDDKQFGEVFPIKEIRCPLMDDIRQSLQDFRSKTISYPSGNSSVEIFIEFILPPIQLLIFGGNYDIYPLVRMAGELGWDCALVANLNKVDRRLVSDGTRLIHQQSTEELVVDPYTAVVIMSHDYKMDLHLLEKMIPTHPRYLGLLGPRKRVVKMFAALAFAGKALSLEDRDRIFAPAGLDIGANSPEEIALSILAEIQCQFNGRPSGFLKLKEGTIHEN